MIVNSPNKVSFSTKLFTELIVYFKMFLRCVQKGETPLHYVCKLRNNDEIGQRDIRTAKLLLKYGANPNLETVEVRALQALKCSQSKWRV